MTTEKYKVSKDPILRKFWRPAIAWLYFSICLCDFIIFPILWALVQIKTGSPLTRYEPITLVAGGLIHVAMGSILSIYTWSRGQELMQKYKSNSARTEEYNVRARYE